MKIKLAQAILGGIVTVLGGIAVIFYPEQTTNGLLLILIGTVMAK